MFFSQLEVTLTGILALLLMPARVAWARISTALSKNQSRNRFERLLQDANLNLRGKIVIVTGSNTGIGRSTAFRLAELGCSTVVLACRDRGRGEEARDELSRLLNLKSAGRSKPSCTVIDFIPLDLSSFQSIREFVKEFSEKYSRLDILVNNAGLNSSGTTQDNLQQLFQVNYLGHYLLTRLLMPLLLKPSLHSDSLTGGDRSALINNDDVGRVVNLSSVMHHLGQCDFVKSAYSQYTSADKLCGYSYYSDSKLYMNFLTMEINNRFYRTCDNSDNRRAVMAISVNPGAVRSDIWRGIQFRLVRWAFDFVSRLLFLDTEDGSTTSVFACIIPTVEVDRYFHCSTSNSTSTATFTSTSTSSSSSFGDGEDRIKKDRKEELGFKTSKKWCTHKNLPYFSPYYVPKNAIVGKLGYECFGPFEYPNETDVSLPADPMKVASELWEFSSQLCANILGEDVLSSIRGS